MIRGGELFGPMLAWAILATALCPPPGAAGPPCSIDSIGVGLEHRQGEAVAILAGSVGETFLARDTLIHSVTVWRSQGSAYGWPDLKLWITQVDSMGTPISYLPQYVLLEGPTVYPPGDTATRAPVKVEFVLEPPFALPGPGKYAFFVQDPCGVGFGLYYNDTDNLYPDGELWFTRRPGSVGSCSLSGANFWRPTADLCFKIEFCQEVPTPVRRQTWGSLKLIYRDRSP